MIWEILGSIIAFTILIYALIKYVFGNTNYWTDRGVYSPSNSVIGPLKDRLSFRIPLPIADQRFYNNAKSKGVKYCGQVVFRHPMLYILDLDLLRNITIKDFDHFTDRKNINLGKNDQLFNLMLINQDGQDWKDLRTTMSPTFSTGKIRRMFNIFNGSAIKMITFIKEELKSSSTLDPGHEKDTLNLQDVFGRYTMDVIASTAFGVDSLGFKDKNSIFTRMGKRFQNVFTGAFIFKIILLFASPKLYEFFGFNFFDSQATDFFKEVLLRSIKHREETGEKREDFLQLMMEAQAGQLKSEDGIEIDEDSKLKDSTSSNSKKIEFTNELILAQCTLFFLAGFDVTETFLLFAVYELACNPEIQDRLFEEIRSGVENNNDELSYEIVNDLPYLDMVVSESLRKYPAAVRGERKCTVDYRVPDSDFVIRKGTHILIPTYGIHHDEANYPEPEKFDPERFNAENKANRHPSAYLPFGLGPRNCIARRFALIEGKTAIANLIMNFKIEPCQKTLIPIEFSTKGVMKPKNGMWLKFKSRASSTD